MPDRVLILSYYFPPMNGPGIQHPLSFHRYLPEFGFSSTVLSSAYYSDESVDPSSGPIPNTHYLPAAGPDSFWRFLYMTETRIQYRLNLYDHGIFPWLPLAWRHACRLIAREGITAILSTSPPLSNHLLAWRLKKKFPHLRWLADLQDPLVGNPFRSARGAVRRWEEKTEHRIFTLADAVSANTDTVRELWTNKYPSLAHKFAVVWNGFDANEPIAPLPLPPRPRPTIAHVGALYGGRLPIPLLASVYRLSQAGRIQPSDFLLHFVGPCSFDSIPDQQQIKTLREQGWFQTQNEYIPRPEALRIAAEADMLLLLDLTYPHNTRLQVPSKIYDYIRIGRPVLAFTPQDSPTERILRRSGIQSEIISSTASPERVDEGLLRFLQLPRDPLPPSPWFLETFDARQLTGRVATLLRGQHTPDS